MSSRFTAGFLGLMVMALLPVDAVAQPASGPRLLRDGHVRAMDRDARRLLERASDCSNLVAHQLDAIQATDLFVIVETRPLGKKMLGQLQMVAASAAVRYVRVTLRVPNAETELVATLGHELHHALEVAGAPEVRDVASQRAFYLRVGYERMGRGLYETDAAIEMGRRVAKEVAGCAGR